MKAIKSKIGILFTLGFSLLFVKAESQSMQNYSVTRATGTSYTSIMSIGNVVTYWRNQNVNLQDDNRSKFLPIGFDYWYNGTRYTYFSINTNGYIDLSSSTIDGNEYSPTLETQPYPGIGNILVAPYREHGAALSKTGGTMLGIAPFYFDIATAGGGTFPIANSIRYVTTGSAPNRILTVEWKDMEDWWASVGHYSFQVKLYESTGKIEFVYGTMTQGSSGIMFYASGLSAASVSSPPRASELLTQRVENTATFDSTRQFNLFTVPASNSTITFTTPVPANPGGTLTFSSITQTSMILNWTDWASNEVGYVVYKSTDGTTYSFVGQVAANTTTLNVTSLGSGTTYYWKVYAVTEGTLSAALTGTQATLSAATYTSITSGLWSDPNTWQTLAVPGLTDDVFISDGTTVTVDMNAQCHRLTIGQGSSGVLTMGNSTTVRNMTVTDYISILSGATFSVNTGFASTHTLTIGGNITNAGTFNMAPNGSSLCNVIFNNNGNQTLTGAGSTFNFNSITLSMGATNDNILDVASSNFTAPTGFLTINNGTFKVSTINAVNISPFGNTPTTISAFGGIWVNSANAIVNCLSTVYFRGELTVSNGTLNIGDAADENLTSNGGLLTQSGGVINIAGRLDRPSIIAVTQIFMSGGTMNICTVGSTSTTIPPFFIDVVGSQFRHTGGTIVIRREGGNGGQDLGYSNTGCLTDYTVNGSGTLQIGDASTPASQAMIIKTNIPIGNLSVYNTNAPTAYLSTYPLTAVQNITVNTGSTFNANNLNVTLGGSITNNGTFTTGTDTVTFNGSSAQQIGGTTSTLALNNVNINNTSGDVTCTNVNVTVSGNFKFTSGKFILGNNNLTLTAGNDATGYSSGRYVVTNGTGVLQINSIGTSARNFPIGPSTSIYNPILNFINNGTVDHFNARVKTGVLDGGTTGSNMTHSVVDRTWLISETTAGGSSVDMTLQWSANEELSSFTRNDCGISHYTSSKWDLPPVFAASSGSNPYTISRSAITSFSPFAIEKGTNPLPIELLSFNAKLNSNQMTDLTWETASETNNDYFTVERSANGKTFEYVTMVKGAGTSTKIIDYGTIDAKPLKGVSYYRLKQTDFDGKYTYSKNVAVELKDNSFAYLSVFPNPFSNNINISCDISDQGMINIVVFNIIGQPVFSTQQAAEKGINLFTINSFEFPPGLYLLKLTDCNGNVKTINLNKN